MTTSVSTAAGTVKGVTSQCGISEWCQPGARPRRNADIHCTLLYIRQDEESQNVYISDPFLEDCILHRFNDKPKGLGTITGSCDTTIVEGQS